MAWEENKVVVYWELTGTHQGVFAGIEPTGKKVKIQSSDNPLRCGQLNHGRYAQKYIIEDLIRV